MFTLSLITTITYVSLNICNQKLCIDNFDFECMNTYNRDTSISELINAN